MIDGGLNRRQFLKATAGLAGAGLIGSAAGDARGEPPTPGETTKVNGRYLTGEPYEPAGKRLVFTNWLYVRPG